MGRALSLRKLRLNMFQVCGWIGRISGKAPALSTSVFSWCFSVLDLVGLCGSLDPVESVVPEGFAVRSGGGREFGNAPFQEATLGFGSGQLQRSPVRVAGVDRPSEPAEQVGPSGVERAVMVELGRLELDPLDDYQRRLRAGDFRDCDGPVELDCP